MRDIVKPVDVDALSAAAADFEGDGGVAAVDDGDHLSGFAAAQQVGGQAAVVVRHQLVEGVGGAGAHEVGQALVDHFVARAVLQVVADDAADAAEFAVAVGVGFAAFDRAAADDAGAFRDGHHGVVARVVAPIGSQQVVQFLALERHLGDDSAIDAGEVRGQQARFAGVASEQLDDEEALVRSSSGTEIVDEHDRSCDGCGEAEAVVRAEDVVVHCFWDGDQRNAFAVKTPRECQSAVAAESHQAVEPEKSDRVQRRAGQIVASALIRFAFEREEIRRDVFELADRRIDARGVQHRAAEAVDRSRVGPAERRDPRGVVGVRLGDDVDQGCPSAAQTEDLVVVVIEQTPYECLDRGIESRHVAAAGEDGDSFRHG